MLRCFGGMCHSAKHDSRLINTLVLINMWQFVASLISLVKSGAGRLCLLKWIRFVYRFQLNRRFARGINYYNRPWQFIWIDLLLTVSPFKWSLKECIYIFERYLSRGSSNIQIGLLWGAHGMGWNTKKNNWGIFFDKANKLDLFSWSSMKSVLTPWWRSACLFYK